jgi:hypothetical protein
MGKRGPRVKAKVKVEGFAAVNFPPCGAPPQIVLAPAAAFGLTKS